jgi:integrase
LLLRHKKSTGQKTLVFGYQEGEQFVAYLYRQHWLRRLCDKAGVKQFGFHGIRHLFASVLAARNVPLVEIQYMLRHDCLTTTQKYIHRLKKENREVLAALPGLQSRFEESPPKVHSDNLQSLIQSAK